MARYPLWWVKCIFVHVVVFASFETYAAAFFDTLCNHILTEGFQESGDISYDRQQVWRSVTSSACCCIHCVWSEPNNMGQQQFMSETCRDVLMQHQSSRKRFRDRLALHQKIPKKQSNSVKKRPNPEILKSDFGIYWCSINVSVNIFRLGWCYVVFHSRLVVHLIP